MKEKIENYLKKHYKTYYNKDTNVVVTHIEDRGYYFVFNCSIGNVLYLNESVMKLDLEYNKDNL